MTGHELDGFIVSWQDEAGPQAVFAETEDEVTAMRLRQCAWLSRDEARWIKEWTYEPLRPTLEHFTVLMKAHDLTYMMSDDGQAMRRGGLSHARLLKVARELPVAELARVWNAWVDTQLIADEAPKWYWRS